MAANLNVTYADMEGAARYLQQGQADLNSQLQSLQNYIQNLVSSGFVTTQASVAFNDTYRQFTQGATQTISALEGLSSFLIQAANTMQETDSALANAIRM